MRKDMDEYMLHAIKNGKDANEVLHMPYSFLIELIEMEAQGAFMTDEQQDALIAAL